MYEMRGEWAQLKGKMANPAKMGASQGGYEMEEPLQNVAPQRTNLEEALMADWEAASSRDPTGKPRATDPEAASTRAPSTEEEMSNEEAHHSCAPKACGCQKKARHNQKNRKKRVGKRTDEKHVRKRWAMVAIGAVWCLTLVHLRNQSRLLSHRVVSQCGVTDLFP